MPPVFCQIDDKLVPLYRILWIAQLPHFCGSDECDREGQYEVRLEHEESLWAVCRACRVPSARSAISLHGPPNRFQV